MSVESAAKFWERLVNDEELLRKLLESRDLISQCGYEFTLEEFAQTLKSRSESGVYPASGKG